MKNNFTKALMSLLAFILIVTIIASPLAVKLHIHPMALTVAITIGAFALHLYSPGRIEGISRKDGVDKEVWADYIVQRFWRDNAFLTRAFNDDSNVLAGKIVHIPQPGALPKVVKNRSVLPASVITRADADVVYMLDNYSTDPTVITEAEKIPLSYDKMDSVYGDHAGVISQDVAGDMIIKWLTGLNQRAIVKTTGSNTSILGDENMSGTRKVHTHQELRQFELMFNKQNLPQDGRQILYTPNLLDQLKESLSNTQWRDFSQYYNAETGVIGKLHSFEILMRSEVAIATNVDATASVLPYGGVTGAADSEVAMVWHKDSVARALGEVKFFENVDRAEYQGSVYSSFLRAGGRRRRADNIGVGMLVQATGV